VDAVACAEVNGGGHGVGVRMKGASRSGQGSRRAAAGWPAAEVIDIETRSSLRGPTGTADSVTHESASIASRHCDCARLLTPRA